MSPRRRTTAVLAAGALALALAACSEEKPKDDDRIVLTPAADGTQATRTPAGDGTQASVAGWTMGAVRLPAADKPGEVSFRITDRAGKPLRDYLPEQTKLLHLYVVRDDLAQFRHVHPELGADGTWRGRVDLGSGGRWRVVAEFIPKTSDRPVVLGVVLPVAGTQTPSTIADAAESADDGVVRVRLLDQGTTGPNGRLRIAVSTPDGKPLQLGSYLGATAHLTGFAVGTRGFVHVHPLGAPEVEDDGTVLTFHTAFTKPGQYRMFVQVRVDGMLHQLAVTTDVTPAE